jgi:hypothetical protein
MAEEQETLATSLFTLVNSLTNPLPGWKHQPVDNVRIAVVSSDLGLQWGGNPYENGDGWPGDTPQGCGSVGDNGDFQTYSSGKKIDIQHDTIPCGAGAAHCPTGWTCSATESDEIGTCQAPGGDGSNQNCPGMAAIWAETPIGPADGPDSNDELAFQAACLSTLGTDGCGIEQPLQAAAVALDKPSQADFLRSSFLLAVLAVSDEEDCSIESNELFATSEIQDTSLGKINIACGENEQFLHSTETLYDAFVAAKGGREDRLIFAAIAGVPAGGDSPCQGAGHELGECLGAEEMQKVPVLDNGLWSYRPACTRYEDNVAVTNAPPGRRYVELAQRAGPHGYVYSVCNAEWSPAMEDIARLIAESIGGTCYPEPLDWDPATRQAKCNVVVEYVDTEQCPFDVGDAEVLFEEFSDAVDVSHTRIFCPLPRLAAALECDDNDYQALDAELGWYYCENAHAEDFDDACRDGLDNDSDGLTDCDDDGCQFCYACDGNGAGCKQTCKHVVQVTEAAKEEVSGHALAIQCLRQLTVEDPNCQENTRAACNDNLDNDSSGTWDCDMDLAGDRPHAPDPHCCPMHADEKNRCVVEPEAFENCPGSSVKDLPDACLSAADLLGCLL